MPRKAAPRAGAPAFEKVKRAAATLAGVEESSSYGTPALKVKGKLFARLQEDGKTLVLRTDFDSRDAMLRGQPTIFHLTDHYRDYPWVLVHLDAIPAPLLRELLAEAWRMVAPKTLREAPAGRPSRRTRDS